jgi:branched-chain amino acid transport system permease protein
LALRDTESMRGAFMLVAAVIVVVWFLPPYALGLLTLIGIYALVTLGLNLFMGYAGQVSLGQAAFVALGAYTTATLGQRAHLSAWLGLIAGALVAAAAAYAVSFVALRLRETYLALATLAFGIVVSVAFNELDYFGGSSGLKDIPGLTIGAWHFDVRAYAIVSWIAVGLGVWFAGNIVRSGYGRALIAISSGELGAATLGVDPERMKREAFVLSAAFAGIAGGLYACYLSYIDATSFGFLLSVNFVLMSVLGGLRSLWGALIGAALVVLLGQALQFVVQLVLPSARGDVQTFFFGAIMVAMLIWLPQGIAGRLQTTGRA